MRKGIFIIVAMTLIMSPGITTAQMQGGPDGRQMMGGKPMMSSQHMIGRGMVHNMEMMSGMMSDMHQMMGRRHMTPDQQRQMMEMMHEMGGIMQEMGMPKEGQMPGEHNKQLQEMKRRLDKLKKHMK
jgi:hypothetical protein